MSKWIHYVDIFARRTNSNMDMIHYRTEQTKSSHRLATELYPYNAINNGTQTSSTLQCAQLCYSYLYCTIFSYNRVTMECRVLVGISATGNTTTLVVCDVCANIIYLYNYFRARMIPIRMKLSFRCWECCKTKQTRV
jgi:hypothetical protein